MVLSHLPETERNSQPDCQKNKFKTNPKKKEKTLSILLSKNVPLSPDGPSRNKY